MACLDTVLYTEWDNIPWLVPGGQKTTKNEWNNAWNFLLCLLVLDNDKHKNRQYQKKS